MARVVGSERMTSDAQHGRAGDGGELDTRYRKMPMAQFARRALGITPEEKKWRAYSQRTDHRPQTRGRVSSIDFCRKPPHNIVVTSQTRIATYDRASHDLLKETHPKDAVHCTTWRQDGRMLVTSGEQPTIRVWTPESGVGKMIRELRPDLERGVGHSRAVHSVCFLADKQRVLSGSDDKTGVIWDMATQEQLMRLEGHSDYVRATAAHPYNENVCVTAGHDGKIILWDLRDGPKAARTWQVSDPVSSVAFHPTGGLLAVASATDVTIWDASRGDSPTAAPGAAPVALLSNHTKDITCVTFNEHGSRLLTGSVDRHVKVYETENYVTVHTMSFAEPVFAVAISPCSSCLAVGTLEGTLHLRSRARGEAFRFDTTEPEEERLYDGLGWVRPRLSYVVPRPLQSARYGAREEDCVVEKVHRGALAGYDRHFQRFNYAKALDDALSNRQTDRSRHNLFHSVLEELVRRNGLRVALSGRSAPQLLPILELVHWGITDPRHCALYSAVLELILEIYHPVIHESREVLRRLIAITSKVQNHCAALQDLLPVRGTMDALLEQGEVRALKRRRVTAD
eukprot:TRINITY_DN47463_c0_g1_i1.p1 TRINITY_DN47463_c0_g1~~TRINITY_DN47463_c0_g1_i1.p1  ORF type:complete len:569 (+),score=175.19 TRINITY_DN47463_c0_g1_i1:99-1805(+)